MKKKTITQIHIYLLVIILLAISPKAHAQNLTCPAIPATAGKASTSLVIKEPGVYKIWTRMKNEDDFNAYILQIPGKNNDCAYIVGDAPTIDEWTWVDYKNGSSTDKIVVNFQAGVYTFNLIGNEPRVGIDKLLLTKEQTCTPVDMGTNCETVASTVTPIVTTTLAPTIQNTQIPTPTSTLATTLNLYAIADTFVNEDKPKNTAGLNKLLYVDGSPERITYIKFDLTNSKLNSKTLVSATLKLRVAKNVSAVKNIHFVPQLTWTESGMSYQNRAPLSSIIVGTIRNNPDKEGWITVPLNINHVQSNIGKMYSVAIEHKVDYRFEIYSRETSSKPSLILKY